MKTIAALALGALVAGCATVPAERSQVALAAPDAIKGVHHVGITVSDIDDTVAFYSKAVPYEVVERRMVPASSLPASVLGKRSGAVEIALVRTPTVFLQLIDIDPASKAPPERRAVTGPGYTHICFQSPSTAPKYDVFKAIGLDMLSRGPGPVDLGGYGVTYAYGFDPDGIMIEMEQLAPAVIAADGERGARRTQFPAWSTHIAQVPGDKAKMVEFYTKVLGYGPRRELPESKRKTYDMVVDIDDIAISASWFDAGNYELEFWHYHKPKTPLAFTKRMFDAIGYNSVVFEVTDLAGTVARLEKEGVVFVGPAFDLGGLRTRYARDPEGNVLGFTQNLTAGPSRSIDGMVELNSRVPSTPRT
ncbi:Glyoxalase-like domain protein [Tsuneonella dongtanensis]|uniref:Glyoxalase-like domain protein n=1 Tax=Tsuneonella dongtanensis TaxID=692370 RepID=A0A1B2AGI1_9SPHN|nr:VOC family protein [Tsuneonella dongtanensis]ANY21135.1 Glyoxalase-like domain protein [Tsuneonella dongtanensis]